MCVRSRTKATLTHSHIQGDKSVRVMRSLLAAQQTFVDRLVQLMKAVQRESGNRKKKVSLPASPLPPPPSQYQLGSRLICLFSRQITKHSLLWS